MFLNKLKLIQKDTYNINNDNTVIKKKSGDKIDKVAPLIEVLVCQQYSGNEH